MESDAPLGCSLCLAAPSGHERTLVDTPPSARSEVSIRCISRHNRRHGRDTVPIALPAKIVALLGALTRADVEELTPVERERFRALCGYWAEIAKPRPMS